MKRLYTAGTAIEYINIDVLKNLLEEAEIRCMTRTVSNSIGEVPFLETSPELWIENDEDYPKALAILETLENAEIEVTGPWICSNCSETVEGQFTSCWQCGRERSARLPAGNAGSGLT